MLLIQKYQQLRNKLISLNKTIYVYIYYQHLYWKMLHSATLGVNLI